MIFLYSLLKLLIPSKIVKIFGFVKINDVDLGINYSHEIKKFQ